MSKLLKSILEADKTKTKEKTVGTDFFSEPKSKGSLEKPEEKTKPSQKRSDGARTRERMRDARINPEHMPSMNADEIDTTDEISDEEAASRAGISTLHSTHNPTDTPGVRPTPVTPNTLPAVISKALATTSKALAKIDPEWHMVKHLPGYMSRQIRALGRSVFHPFTSTPIEDIQVLAHLGDGTNGGPNSMAEVEAVTKYVSSHGVKDTTAELEFHRVLPEYSAKVAIYNCNGCTFFLVKDFAGAYIYSWPQSDSKELHGTMPAGLEHNQRSVEREVRHIERSKPKQISHEINWDDEG